MFPHVKKLPSRILLLAASTLLAQPPAINPNGIVNAASLAPHPVLGAVVSSGSLVVVLGQALASDTIAAQDYPLPRALLGTTVAVNGTPAPLLSVSPTRIQFQAPTAPADWPPVVPVVVSTPLGSSDPTYVRYIADSAGAFTLDGSGCGRGVIENVSADGVRSINSPDNSASPGGLIAVYGTGFGEVYFPPPDGSASVDPLSKAIFLSEFLLGLTTFERSILPDPHASPATLKASYSGRVPGMVGVDVINLYLSADAAEGCSVPLKVSRASSNSQPVLISVRKGGGPCQDPPLARIGYLRWSKIISSPRVSPSVSETLETTLIEAPGNLIAAPPVAATTPSGPSCPGAAGRGLDAGIISIADDAGNSYAIGPSAELGTLAYLKTQFPVGTLQGALTLTSSGGADLGPLQGEINIPEPIQVIEPLLPGTSVQTTLPLTVTWKGGTPDVNVSVALIRSSSLIDGVPSDFVTALKYCGQTVRGDKGTVTLTPTRLAGLPPTYPCDRGPDVNVVVQVTPVTPPDPFSAAGLPQPGLQTWSYEYRFTGLVAAKAP